MGQKSNPIGMRLGIIRSWDSNWYDEKTFSAKLVEDMTVRDYIRNRLKKAGVWTVGLTADADNNLFGLSLLTEPVAIVAGAEGKGLSRLVEERVDVRASIPMATGVESLNVSVAAALAMFEISRVRANST